MMRSILFFKMKQCMSQISLSCPDDLKICMKILLVYHFELRKTYGIHILNGRSPGDTEGEITCTANDGYSIVDYFIASSNLF